MKLKIIAVTILSTLFVIFSLDIGIFWDNVLFASKMGKAVYANGIFDWHIPLEFDPGHPPFLATIMAIGWTLFGKSLAVAHWLMLPFVFGLLWQLHSFVAYFITDKRLQITAFILLLADPTLLSQLVLVNPEVLQMFFFFLALNGLLRNKPLLKMIGLAFLGIVTFRGMMLCAGFFLVDLTIHLWVKKDSIRSFLSKQTLVTYLIGAIPATTYVLWRLLAVGWLQTHPDSPWANLWHVATVPEFIRNVAVLAQRYLDFGRIAIFAVLMISLIRYRKSITSSQISLLLIAVSSCFVITAVSLLSTNAMGHRYFIASYLAFALLAFSLLQKFKFRKTIYAGLLGSLLAGNFVVYPDSFSQGWDASLAHLPYWSLRTKAIDFMDQEQIPVSKTATFFPNQVAIDDVVLNGDQRSFIPFTGSAPYVFYSNVFNLSDQELNAIHEHYHILKTFRKGCVRIEILEMNK